MKDKVKVLLQSITLILIITYYLENLLHLRPTPVFNPQYLFLLSFIPFIIITIYSYFVSQNKAKLQTYIVTGTCYAVSLVAVIIALIDLRVNVNVTALLVIFNSQISRILQRSLNLEFPLITYLLCLITAYFSINNIYLNTLPFIYFVIQVAEDLLRLKYNRILKYFESVMFNMSMIIFYIFIIILVKTDLRLGFWFFLLFFSFLFALGIYYLKQRR